MMPRLSGVDLCRRMRGDAVLKDIPVILLSAVLPHGAPEASAFLHKPFEITDFEALVRKSLAQAPEPARSAEVAPVEALGRWVAQTLQGPLTAAREQLQRLQQVSAVDRQALEALEAQLHSMELLSRSLREAAGSALQRAMPEELSQYLRRVEEAWRTQAAEVSSGPAVPGDPLA
jgi:DNA-binding response OmpR family regulator